MSGSVGSTLEVDFRNAIIVTPFPAAAASADGSCAEASVDSVSQEVGVERPIEAAVVN
eukprot:CAMPEP_0170372616 /NCGR_PEP_ID=MMETSP0117_2-20130122/9645_1 /TAXON_ID=400756 /ORGANISM="Durinskia baltica, Strain CSIRO CS-38" /LENGTH=57 /DNA_ID=CAMNT_0010627481 /DNA_START=684 /DNA_END=857 /DNA_ORIENTATION=-